MVSEGGRLEIMKAPSLYDFNLRKLLNRGNRGNRGGRDDRDCREGYGFPAENQFI